MFNRTKDQWRQSTFPQRMAVVVAAIGFAIIFAVAAIVDLIFNAP